VNNKKNMKKILLSLAMIAMVSTVAVGATRAYFSASESNIDNTFSTGTLDISLAEFMSWEFPFTNMKPGDETGIQRLRITIEGSIYPDHL